MPFASLKKSRKKQQRHYKERSQPERRAHLGQLEKHKDYVVRARDYQRKAAALKGLRQRARGKNEDEFYFHMNRSQLRDGQHTELAADDSVPDDAELKLLLEQDANYLRYRAQLERKKLESLEASLSFCRPAARRTVFSREDFRRHRDAGDGEEDNGDGEEDAFLEGLDEAEVARLAKGRVRLLTEAKQRIRRLQLLRLALATAETKRHLAAESGRPRKLVAKATPDSPAVWKFAFKRKR